MVSDLSQLESYTELTQVQYSFEHTVLSTKTCVNL